MRWQASIAVAFAALAPFACARVDIERADLCLTWGDASAPVVSATPPENLACETIHSSGDPVPKGDYELEYVCVDPGADACPAPRDAYALFGKCVGESRTGEGCDHPLSGACTTRAAYSACGPDQTANGACCYYVYVVTSTILS